MVSDGSKPARIRGWSAHTNQLAVAFKPKRPHDGQRLKQSRTTAPKCFFSLTFNTFSFAKSNPGCTLGTQMPFNSIVSKALEMDNDSCLNFLSLASVVVVSQQCQD